jgi:hypothetical protein
VQFARIANSPSQIDEQGQPVICSFQIIQCLCLVRASEISNSLYLNNDLTFHKNISNIVTNQLALKVNIDRSLLDDPDALPP